MWTSQILAVAALVLLLFPNVRRQENYLFGICVAVVTAIWIEKGLGMIVTGFIPTPLDKVTEYAPTIPEGLITLGVYGLGFLILTVLYKMAISVREETEVQ